MNRGMVAMLCVGVMAGLAPCVNAADGHPIAQPLGGEADVGEWSYNVVWESPRIPTEHLGMGAEHILMQQCHNGGFGWEHDDCSATFHNITAPILLGVLGSYYHLRDDALLVGALNGGAFDLTHQFDNGEARFGSFTPFFMYYLALASGNTTFATFAEEEFFDELAAGTYSHFDDDTAGWIARVEDNRTGAQINLRSWDFHTLIYSAKMLGQSGQDDLFVQAVLDGLATLDNGDPDNVYSDIIGLAGAVRGLAFARRYTFPAISAPLHPGVDGIDNLEDLAAYLSSLQNPDGSWYWHSNLAAPVLGDEDVQTTAYALLALLEVDIMTAANHQPATEAARNWIVSLQTPDGGFPKAPGSTENTEVEGEALDAIATYDARFFVDGFEAGDAGLWDVVWP